jgi:tetratricopeptide (TPR) repeat protein
MSRSIHETRLSWARLRKFDYSNSAEKAEVVRKAVRRLWKKRRIKRAVWSERHLPVVGSEPVSVATIPIDSETQKEHVYHGASEADVRELLRAMPCLFTEGINRVHLCLGKEYMDELKQPEATERDPIHQRLSFEVVPGLHAPPVLGTYAKRSGDIAIYAYVWDRERTAAIPSVVMEFYLRAQSLWVLVHEVAHHYDHARRIARGRWLSDRKENYEHYAEQRQWDWTHHYIYPYLNSHYGAEWQAVKAWVRQHGGVEPTLDHMMDDPRDTMRNGMIRLSLSATFALIDMFKSVVAGEGLTRSRLAYAWGLHYADQYEMSLAISQRLVEEEPANTEALSLHADTLEHLDRFSEASDFVEQVLQLNPLHEGALKTKARLKQEAKDWPALLAVCHAWLKAIPEGKSTIFAYRTMAVALCALGRFEEMDAAIEAGIQGPLKNDPTLSGTVRRLTFKRAGQELPNNSTNK